MLVQISSQISLASFTSWQIGGSAEFFCLPKNVNELIEAQAWASEKNVDVKVLGHGSNVLIPDEGVKGLVICLKDFSGLEIISEKPKLEFVCWAGTAKSELLKLFLKYKLPPALFLAGIPGDVGGGIVMNAGVAENFNPREFVEITEWIEVLRPNNKIERIESKKLNWSYRHCDGWRPGIIIRAAFSWQNEPDNSTLDQVRNANRVRLTKQPLDMPSCGSVFTNPAGHKAAQLIDSCGLKGYTIGGAQISNKHANFIVNLGNATAKDVWSIIQHVQKIVLQNKGVELKTEVVKF